MSTKPARLNTPGQVYRDFQVTKAIEITEIQCFIRELIHIPTQAVVMHISNNDQENVFCLSFQTRPDSSDGVAHILEHLVLCGSDKFPIKDPFFAMTRRSLNTYMNALTGCDFTCYPAASQVSKDFYNILDVYLDAVFHPTLNQLSFKQEGHRLEFEIPTDPSSPLQYKGIVFNEMKGAMASSMSRLNEIMNQALFPNLTYGYNSGGDPQVIPQLKYEELVKFHKEYYHPSRCLFYFYGNLPLEGHLDFILENTLKDVKKTSPLPSLPRQTRMTSPLYLQKEYPISEEESSEDKTIIAFGWLTCLLEDQEEVLALCILDIILMCNDASPLKHGLLKSGLCKQASAYMDVEITEIPVLIVLKGCDASNADALEKAMRDTLEQIVARGIDLNVVENAMHQLEIARSEITGDHAPFGLSLFMRSALLKQHGVNAEEGLMIHSLFDRLRQRNLANPQYLPSLIQKYFLDNPHFVRLIMLPSKELAKQENEQEREALDKIRSMLTKKQEQEIIEQAAQLNALQLKQEEADLDVLPKILLADVPKAAQNYLLKEETVNKLSIFTHSCFTNEIIYTDHIFDLPQIPEEELYLIRLLSLFFSQIGTKVHTYTDILNEIQAHTGGIKAAININAQASNHREFTASFNIQGKALYRKATKLFDLINELVNSLDFSDIPRIKEVLLKHDTELQSSFVNSALKYAMNLSSSEMSTPGKLLNQLYGLDYYWKIRELIQNLDRDLPSLISKLKALSLKILGQKAPQIILTCDAVMYDNIKQKATIGYEERESFSQQPWDQDYPLKPIPNQGRIIASPVAFAVTTFLTVSYEHPDSPSLNLAAALFDHLTLHTTIREQGGAYGGGAFNNPLFGKFYFYSYRDPNIVKTLDAFEESVKEILSGNFDDEELEAAKLEVIQAWDTPLYPGSRGERAYSWKQEGKTFEKRQAFRTRLLQATREDIINAVKIHIAPKLKNATTVVFAGKELLEKENQQFIAENKPPLIIEAV